MLLDQELHKIIGSSSSKSELKVIKLENNNDTPGGINYKNKYFLQ